MSPAELGDRMDEFALAEVGSLNQTIRSRRAPRLSGSTLESRDECTRRSAPNASRPEALQLPRPAPHP
jgi:hypothetical protein